MTDLANDPDRPIVYYDDDLERYIFRASALSKPDCQMVYATLSMERTAPPADLRQRWDDGKRLESTIVDRLKTLGWVFDDDRAQQSFHINIGKRARINGHVDGIATPPANVVVKGPHVVEIKTFAESSMEQARRTGTGSLPWGYAEQMSFYMLATGLPGYWVAGQKIEGDGWEKDIGELHFEEVVEPPVPKAALVKKIMGVIKKAEDPEWDPAENCPGEYGCPYWTLHSEKEKPETPEADSGDQAVRIDELCGEWLQRDEQIKYEQDKLKKVKEELEEILDGRGSIRGGKYRYEAASRTTRTLPLKDVEAAGLLEGKLKELLRVTESRFLKKPEELG